MDVKRIKSVITEYITGISDSCTLDYGFCSADRFDDAGRIYEQRIEGGLSCELENRRSLEELIDPGMTINGVRSIVVIAVPYAKYEYSDSRSLGRMASGTAELDYHTKLFGILQPLKVQLYEKFGVSGKAVVDTSPLSDRSLAVRAGLGIIRRNGMCYHRRFGSYFHIGALLMDCEMEVVDHSAPADPCGRCRRCVEFCPGNAVTGDYGINSNRCVSYLTQKKALSEGESAAIGQMIYGCDICQRVCPANRGLKLIDDEKLVDVEVRPVDLLAISNAGFKETYKRTASGWRGKKVLQRNAIAVMGNSGDDSYVPVLAKCLEDERPDIRQEAKRALNRLQKNSNSDWDETGRVHD